MTDCISSINFYKQNDLDFFHYPKMMSTVFYHMDHPNAEIQSFEAIFRPVVRKGILDQTIGRIFAVIIHFLRKKWHSFRLLSKSYSTNFNKATEKISQTYFNHLRKLESDKNGYKTTLGKKNTELKDTIKKTPGNFFTRKSTKDAHQKKITVLKKEIADTTTKVTACTQKIRTLLDALQHLPSNIQIKVKKIIRIGANPEALSLFLTGIREYAHEDLAKIWEAFFARFSDNNGIDGVLSWRKFKTGGYELILTNPLKLWVDSKDNHGKTESPGGTVLLLGASTGGKVHIELTRGKMKFVSGFEICCIGDVDAVFPPNDSLMNAPVKSVKGGRFSLEKAVTVFRMVHRQGPKPSVQFVAGIKIPIYGELAPERVKTVDYLTNNWSNGTVVENPLQTIIDKFKEFHKSIKTDPSNVLFTGLKKEEKAAYLKELQKVQKKL